MGGVERTEFFLVGFAGAIVGGAVGTLLVQLIGVFI